jgi:salicylate hydroxylase
MIDRTLKWPMFTSKPLDSWVSKSGKLVILGDAAHVMVPYMSQGNF